MSTNNYWLEIIRNWRSNMGTNFYWLKKQPWMEEFDTFDEEEFNSDNEGYIFKHIGKRSGMGPYCEKCGASLCKMGSRYAHNMEVDGLPIRWEEVCPVCHKEDNIKTVCSFTWTFMRHKQEIEKLIKNGYGDKKLIENEYGERFTAREFLDELKNVRMESQDAVVFY